MPGPTDGDEATVTVLLVSQRLPTGAIAFDLQTPNGGTAGLILATDPEYPAADLAIENHVPQRAKTGFTGPTIEVSAGRVRELIQRSWG